MSEVKKNSGNDVSGEWTQSEGAKLEAGAEGVKEYTCDSCGAVMVCDGQLGATECPYCGNPAIMESVFTGMNLPDGIIPFANDKKVAQEAMENYYKGKKLLPPGFVNSNRLEEIKGVYVPFWLFDCDCNASGFYTATKERTFEENGSKFKETKEYAVSRIAKMRYEKVPADGAKEMRDEYMDSIEPFDYSKIIPYDPAYFSGYLASKYDETADDVKPRVNGRIKNTSEEKLRESVTGYDSVHADRVSVDIKQGKVTYCMLPVWMLTTRWNGNAYTFAMNGQTGKVTGDLPIDKGQCTKHFCITFAIAAVICFLVSYFLFSLSIGPAIGASAVISAIIAFIALSSAKSAMVSHVKTEAKHYFVDSAYKMLSSNDKHVRTRKEKIETPNS